MAETHTVFGPPGVIESACHAAEHSAWRTPSASGLGAASVLPESAGVVLRACEELLACANNPGSACSSLRLSAQYIQIYDESLIDLISGSRDLRLRELGDYAEYAPDSTTTGTCSADRASLSAARGAAAQNRVTPVTSCAQVVRCFRGRRR